MKKIITRIISSFAVCLMMIYAGTSSAATFTAIASGNWSYATTWSGGNIPPFNVTSDDIVIGTGFVINLDQDLVINRTGLLTSASLTVDGELRSLVAGRVLTMTRGDLNGSGTIQLGTINFQSTSTIGFTGTIIADEVHHSILSLATTGSFDIKNELHLVGGLSIGGNLSLAADGEIVVEGGSLSTTGSGTLNLGSWYDVSYVASSVSAGGELGGAGLRDVTIDVGSGNAVTVNTNVVVNGMLTLSSGEMDLNGHHLIIKGDVAANGSGVIGSSAQSDINLEDSGAFSGMLRFHATRNTVRNFTISRVITGSGSVQLGSDLNVSGILNLAKTGLDIGNYTLNIENGGSITGTSKNRYIMTGASGRLGISLSSGGSYVLYPIGTQDHYAPASVRLAAGNGTIKINVINQVYANGTAGDDLSATQKMVKGTWTVTSDISTLNYDLKLMWDGSMEANSFDRSSAYVSYYAGGTWDASAGMAATSEGDQMYSLTRTSNTGSGPFAVFQTGATGIADISLAAGAAIYPNPASEFLVIDNVGSGYVNIEIINEIGQVMKTGRINGTSSLNVNDLERGNYFIRISDDRAATVKKFVKL
jgi:hypothetical protein